MPRRCKFVRAGQQCERNARRAWTTCPKHYTAGRFVSSARKQKAGKS